MAGRASLATLLLRCTIGVIFLLSGLEKLVPGPAYAVQYFSNLGIGWPEVMGPLVSWFEVLGGVGLVAGLLTPALAGAFVLEMIVAIVAVRLPLAPRADSLVAAFDTVRLELMLMVGGAVLVLIGPGEWSADRIIGSRRAARTNRPR